MAKRSLRTPKSIGLLREPTAELRSGRYDPRDPAQPSLPFDPFPARIEPCLAQLADEPPVGDEWSFEVKWDGYRLALHFDGRDVRALTRNGHDWTHRFPSIVGGAGTLDAATFVLDGEAVVLDDRGRSDFNALQKTLGGRNGRAIAGREVVFYGFDLLYFDGHDLTGMALEERRHLLEDFLSDRDGPLRLSEEVRADGGEFLAAACRLGLEGIIAKRRDKPYRSGRSGDWLKLKCIQSETFAVVGYEPSSKVRGAIANLRLAARRGNDLVYVGSVGTGFGADEAVKLKERLDAIRTTGRAASTSRGRAVQVEPGLVAEIAFRGWTGDGKLRHASFKGIRPDADRGSVYELAHLGC